MITEMFNIVHDAALTILICVMVDKIMKGDSYNAMRVLVVALLFTI